MERLLFLARAHPGWALLLILAGCAAIWLAVSRLYTSEQEKVLETLSALRDGVVEGDVDRVLGNVSPYFSEGGINKERLRGALRKGLTKKPLSRAYLISREVEMMGGTARVRARVVSTHDRGRALSEWEIMLERIDERWYVRRATPLEVNGREVPGLRWVLYLQQHAR